MATIDVALRAVAPKANAAFVQGSILCDAPAIMVRWGLKTPQAQAQLLAHMAHESVGLTRFEEGMSYSAQRLTQVWPKRFPSIAAATPYAKNPKALAINVYGGRMGNRPGTEDGWSYRGSGALQHTGRSEFERVTNRAGMNVLGNPEKLRKPLTPADVELAWHAACSFVADKPGALAAFNEGSIEKGTQKVNGGQIGIADRRVLFRRANAALAGKPIELRSTPGVVAKPAEAPPIVVVAKTSAEEADDADSRAKKATTGTIAVGTTASGADAATEVAKPTADYTTAIAIAIGFVILAVVVGLIMFRKARTAKELHETVQLEDLKVRAEVVA